MMIMRSRKFVPLLVLVPLLTGCGGDPLGSVKGTVTLDDNPLPNGTLTFEMPGRRPATAKVVNGQIVQATTFQPGDGVPVGAHKVAVSATEAAAGVVVDNPGDTKGPPKGDYMSGKSLIPTKYNNPETSGLTAEIKSGENTITLKLTSK